METGKGRNQGNRLAGLIIGGLSMLAVASAVALPRMTHGVAQANVQAARPFWPSMSGVGFCNRGRRAMPTLEQIQPYTPIIIMAINGLIAGWLAGLLLGGGGLIRNLVVGLIGAFVGGALVRFGLLKLPEAVIGFTSKVPYGEQILISTIGAIASWSSWRACSAAAEQLFWQT